MKKVLIVLGIAAALCVTGCKDKDLGVYDPSVAEAERATLKILNLLTVTNFDARTVNWKQGIFLKISLNKVYAVISVPSGKHTFTADYFQSKIGATSEAKGLQATFDLEPGHVYELKPETEDKKVWLTLVEVTP
jgi:hypothetical protein